LICLTSLRKTRELAVLLITHDLGVVGKFAERVAVMYTGKIVEESPVDELFARKASLYRRSLRWCQADRERCRKAERLQTIEGTVPSRLLCAGCHSNRLSIPDARCKEVRFRV